MFNHKLFFNPKAGLVGMAVHPFMSLVELLAACVEVFGAALVVVCYFMGILSIKAFVIILLLALGATYLLSACTLLMEEIYFHFHSESKSLMQLIALIFLEAPFYRLIQVYWRFLGLLQWLWTYPGTCRKMKEKPIREIPRPERVAHPA